jgi:hypothetical protein
LGHTYLAPIKYVHCLLNDNKTVSEQNDIGKELYKYYSEQFKEQLIDLSDSHGVEIVNEPDEILKIISNSIKQMERFNTV